VTPGFLGAVFLEDILAQLIFASDILTQLWKSCAQEFERSKEKKKFNEINSPGQLTGIFFPRRAQLNTL
jgi:hypothetical protein